MILCGSYRKNGTFFLHRKALFLPVSSPAYLEVSTSHLCLLHSSPFPCIKSPILHLLILSLFLFICECKAAFIHGYHREKSSLCHTSSSHQQHIQSTARAHTHRRVCIFMATWIQSAWCWYERSAAQLADKGAEDVARTIISSASQIYVEQQRESRVMIDTERRLRLEVDRGK